jgi:hypothetical protein
MKCPECGNESDIEIHVPYMAEKVYVIEGGKLVEIEPAWIESSGTVEAQCECGNVWEISDAEFLELMRQLRAGVRGLYADVDGDACNRCDEGTVYRV